MYKATIKHWKGNVEEENSYVLEALSLDGAIKEAKSKISDYGDRTEICITRNGTTVYSCNRHSQKSAAVEVAKWQREEAELVRRLRLDVTQDSDISWAIAVLADPAAASPEHLKQAAGILHRVVPGVQDPVLARAVLMELRRVQEARKDAEHELAYFEMGAPY